jgi:hypothetical protein
MKSVVIMLAVSLTAPAQSNGKFAVKCDGNFASGSQNEPLTQYIIVDEKNGTISQYSPKYDSITEMCKGIKVRCEKEFQPNYVSMIERPSAGDDFTWYLDRRAGTLRWTRKAIIPYKYEAKCVKIALPVVSANKNAF